MPFLARELAASVVPLVTDQMAINIGRRDFISVIGWTIIACPLAANAQQQKMPANGFPNKTLRIIVPFTPGGAMT